MSERAPTPRRRTQGRGPERRQGPRPATGADPRARAADHLATVTDEGVPLSAILDAGGAFEGLEPRDQGLARALLRTAVRRRGDIDHVLGALMDRPLPKRAGRVRAVLRIAAAQLLFMRQADHAAVNVAVALLKGGQDTAGFAGLANAVLRRLVRERDDQLAALPVAANTPDWLWRRWVSAYGEAAAAGIAAAHREEPPLDLSRLPGTPMPEGAALLPTGGVRLAATDVTALDGFGEGAFWVQDMAAQLPVTLAGPLEGKTAIDLCAAPGGKTLQLAAGGATVTAVEKDAGRAERLTDNLSRTSLPATVRIGDAREANGVYDVVLLDAPCSSTGTLRRQPDVAFAKSLKEVRSLAERQRDLIDHAVSLTAPGGVFVYAVCSLEPEEGEAQREWLLARHNRLSPIPVAGPAAPFALPEGGIRTLPCHDAAPGLPGLDGFFAAAFRAR